MVNVAIAGGTGNVGRTIVEIFKAQKRHQAFLLTRSSNPSDIGIPVIQVDYSDPESLTSALEKNNIHTVVSCVSYEGDALKVAQMNLIRASSKSSATKRFIPSTFGIAYPADAVEDLPMLSDYFAAFDELKKSGLEWTSFHNGTFLDYWAMPHIKTFLRPMWMSIDIPSRMAAIPGDGNSRFTLTYSYDAAKYLVALMDLDTWPETSRVAGDIVTWHEFLKLVEEVTGERFKVTYDSVENLKKFQPTDLPSHALSYEDFPKDQFRWFLSIISRWTTDEDVCYIPGELNSKFPEIKPMSLKGMLEAYWKGK
ncbi:NmrA-like family protein [Pleurostoma richardsiae]|uniref:NmrA-like family protein n=1 Tax=Pleurostoma richardsiae TaxID=41990 RepID=A0AA38R0X1_9PEZI|nr:NmrA-like family protein [Pleurostoma richardsiae]